jgi:hypothetical protein
MSCAGGVQHCLLPRCPATSPCIGSTPDRHTANLRKIEIGSSGPRRGRPGWQYLCSLRNQGNTTLERTYVAGANVRGDRSNAWVCLLYT